MLQTGKLGGKAYIQKFLILNLDYLLATLQQKYIIVSEKAFITNVVIFPKNYKTIARPNQRRHIYAINLTNLIDKEIINCHSES